VSEKFTTAELIAYVQRWKNCCASPYIDDESEADVQKCIDIERAIVARLRAADALCAAAKDAKHELTFAPCRDNPERTSCLKCGTTEALRKATADYEEGQ